jgi:hypothetical protein
MFFSLKVTVLSSFSGLKWSKSNLKVLFWGCFMYENGPEVYQLYQLFHLFRGTLIAFCLPIGTGNSAITTW